MPLLNCKAGDHAVAVNCELRINNGNLVEVIKAVGYQEWTTLGELFVWHVRTLSNSPGKLCYEDADGWVEEQDEGPVPDIFLRPLKKEKCSDHATKNTELPVI